MLGLFGWQVANEKMYAGSKVTLDWDLPGFDVGSLSMYSFGKFVCIINITKADHVQLYE